MKQSKQWRGRLQSRWCDRLTAQRSRLGTKEQIGIFCTKLEHSGFLHEAVEVGDQVISVVAVYEAFAAVVHKPAQHVSAQHSVCPVVLLHTPAGRGHPKQGHNMARRHGDIGHPAQCWCCSAKAGRCVFRQQEAEITTKHN